MNGHIKLHRSIFDWEWWDDINTFRLFVTILLLANWKEKRWHGKTIRRGSLWTSLPTLSQRSGLTMQQTRTALNKLISTGEITDKATREGRLITVVNYGKYQAGNAEATDKLTDDLTDEQQTNNRRATVTEEREELLRRGEKEEGDLLFFKDID